MKKLKQFGSLVLALMLAVALSCPAFAAGETYTITINGSSEGHTYQAYQIFTGDLSKGKLSNIKWGSGVDAAKVATKFSGKSAADVAEDLAKAANNSDEAKAYAKDFSKCLSATCTESEATEATYSIRGLSAGYYLVKDKDKSLTSEADDFYTGYIMEVVGDVTATPKGEKPTLDKQIKHNEENSGEGTWGVVGDNQIGDTVEFRTITTVPDTKDYTSYIYKIHDTMSEGLTSNVNSAANVTIKVNDDAVLEDTYYTLTANGNSFTLTVDVINAIKNGKMTAGDQLFTYYTGVLNERAKVYDEGNQNNAAYLEYSNNPNDTSDTGKTPEKKVYDWTFKMGINKVDEKDTSLTGAKFVLSNNGNLKVADMNCNDEGVPSTITNLIGLIKVSDGVYRVAKTGEANIVYAIDAGNPVIKGLDDAVEYYLYETKAPAGYNMLSAPTKFKINTSYVEDGHALTSGMPTVTIDAHEPSATLTVKIQNKSGSTLPTTGGMGTTVLYVVGGALVVCAGVALVAKKRMQ